jgi:hypothetical protein
MALAGGGSVFLGADRQPTSRNANSAIVERGIARHKDTSRQGGPQRSLRAFGCRTPDRADRRERAACGRRDPVARLSADQSFWRAQPADHSGSVLAVAVVAVVADDLDGSASAETVSFGVGG